MSPDRPYVPRRYPPNMLDRIASHRWDVLLAGYGIVTGVLRVLDAYFESYMVTTTTVPYLPSFAISISWIVGGSFWLFGIFRRFETMNTYYHIVRSGLTIVGIGWSAYFFSAVFLNPQAANVWLWGLTVSIGVWGMYLETFQNETRTRKQHAERVN